MTKKDISPKETRYGLRDRDSITGK